MVLQALKEIKVQEVTRVLKEPKVLQGLQEIQDHKVVVDHKVQWEMHLVDLLAHKEMLDLRDQRVTQALLEHREIKDLPVLQVINDLQDLIVEETRVHRVIKVPLDHKENRVLTQHHKDLLDYKDLQVIKEIFQ